MKCPKCKSSFYISDVGPSKQYHQPTIGSPYITTESLSFTWYSSTYYCSKCETRYYPSDMEY